VQALKAKDCLVVVVVVVVVTFLLDLLVLRYTNHAVEVR
jgi:hypothetical protein